MYNRNEWAMILVKKETRNHLREKSYATGRKMWDLADEAIRGVKHG